MSLLVLRVLGAVGGHCQFYSQNPCLKMNIPNDVHPVLSPDGLESPTVSIHSPISCPKGPHPSQLASQRHPTLIQKTKPDHTLHPSHSLFTDDRVFIPRICSSCLTPTAPTPASICFCCTPDRKFLSPFASDSRLKLNCENDREKNVGRDSDCGRIWRRVPVEAPRMERRDIIVGGPREDMDFGDPPVSRSGGRIRIYLILRRG